MSVDCYDPQMVEAWRRAGSEHVIIAAFATYEEAGAHLSQMIFLRMEMRRENHPVYEQARRAYIEIAPNLAPIDDELTPNRPFRGKGYLLIGRPRDWPEPST